MSHTPRLLKAMGSRPLDRQTLERTAAKSGLVLQMVAPDVLEHFDESFAGYLERTARGGRQMVRDFNSLFTEKSKGTIFVRPK